ncbi:MAG: tetratricopeptide repeat protein [Halioglobus sp.]
MALCQIVLRGSVLGLLTVLAACTSYKPQPETPAPVITPPGHEVGTPPEKPQTPPPARPASPSASAAWQPLLAKAEQATRNGDYEQALALLERAQRIDPDSGEVYLSMAQTHQAKGDRVQARVTAERGLLYCTTEALCNALRAFTR